MLSGCADYPGADPPCTGSQKNAPGCDPPNSGLKDDPNGGDWYIDWAFKIVRDMLSNLAIQAVNLAVSTFWSIFTNLASTDFAGCSAGNGTGAPVCAAVDAFNAIRAVAYVFFPAILMYRTFKSYFLGNWIEGWYENFLSIFGRLLVAGFCIMFLEVLLTGAFGISNQLFNAISGGPQGMNEIAKAVVGHGWDQNAPPGSPLAQPAIGVMSVQYIQNIGLMIFALLVCLAMALVFILLGVVFLLRTIIVFILFAMSPLGVLAGTLDEFKPWFMRWFQSVQAMLIAPLPVAICFRLVGSFAQNVPGAHDNPPEFILTMVYIISFLAIGTLLMFKIAGALGGVMFGALTAVAGLAVGGAVGALGAMKLSGGQGEEDKNEKNLAERKKAESKSSGSEASQIESGPNYSLQEMRQQADMASALRTMTEAMKANSFASSPPPPRLRFNHLAQENLQHGLHWAGEEAGVSAPYLSLAPYRHRQHGGNNNNILIFQPASLGAGESNTESPPPAPADYESSPPKSEWPKPPPTPSFIERGVERNLERLENSLIKRTAS